MNTMRLILGSQSPRRREILEYFSIPFEQKTSGFNEDSIPFDGDPKAYAIALSEGKARSLLPQFPDATIITADTIVYKAGKLFGKPTTEEEAFQILNELCGSWHSVYTAVSVMNQKTQISGIEETRVLFHPLSPSQIRAYCTAFHCFDKAGGYGIQEGGHLIVKRIEGCFYNVMGLPLNTLHPLLLQVGIDLWNFLKKVPSR